MVDTAYPITKEAFDLFTAPYRQVVDITVHGINGDLHITDADIVSGGFSVNRYCASGSRIEIGSVVAAEMELQLNNADGRFNDVVFEGAEMFVRVGTKKWDAKRWEDVKYHYIPLGYFTVDEAPRKLDIITLPALDRMVLFDKPVDMSLLSFPMTVEDLLTRICGICNVPLGINVSAMTNSTYVINEAPEGVGLTYRQLLSWIAELTGTCGFIDWGGRLILKWYEETDTKLTSHERFDSDIEEKAVTITGVQVVAGEETFLEGTDEYAFNIEGNGLIQHDYREVASTLYSALGGFTYTPFSAVVKPMPHLYPLDCIAFVDKNGIEHKTIITSCTFTLNKNTALEGRGETATRNGYASANPLTKRETAIIANLKREQNKTLDNRVQSVLDLNETISNSLGLYRTDVTMSDGSIVTYFHDKPTLEESTIIYVRNAGGFAWTHSWNDGNPIWEYGFTQDGNAVYNALSAWKIQTQYLDAECVTAEKLSVEYRQSVQDDIDASATALEQSFKVGLGELNSSIAKTLKSYSTTEETKSLIQLSADGIRTYVSGTLYDYAKTTELESSIKQTSDSIMLEVNKKVNDTDFGTKIEQNYSSVRIAWNNNSKYIEFTDASLNIYKSTAQGNDNLLMKLCSTGAEYYCDGYKTGKIGTNRWDGNSNFRGLVFDLDYMGSYMCWAYKPSAEAAYYYTNLLYLANDSERGKKGIHFTTATYLNGNTWLNDNVRFFTATDGASGISSTTKPVYLVGPYTNFVCGDNYTIGKSKNSLVDCYNNIDLHNYSILNQSDARYKENIVPTSVDALATLSMIDLKAFDWIESGEHTDIGIIAQQLKEVIPELVSENHDTGRLSVKTDKLIPYLVKAVQELSSIIAPRPLALAEETDSSKQWVDKYTDEEKREFISKNQPSAKPKIVEPKPLLIPIEKPKEENKNG